MGTIVPGGDNKKQNYLNICYVYKPSLSWMLLGESCDVDGKWHMAGTQNINHTEVGHLRFEAKILKSSGKPSCRPLRFLFTEIMQWHQNYKLTKHDNGDSAAFWSENQSLKKIKT